MSVESVIKAVEEEGLEYAMRYYSDWKEVASTEFHKLRDEFVKAAEALEKHLGVNNG